MAKKKKKKSPVFTMIVLLLVIIVLVIGYFVAKGIADKSGEETVDADTKLLHVDTSTAKTLKYSIAGNEYTLNCVDGIWKAESDDKRPLDQTKVQNMVNRFAEMTASKVVADNQNELASVALDNPALTVTLTLEDGSSYSYSTGSTVVTDDGGCYAIVKGYPGVYILPEGYYNMFSANLNSITQLPSVADIKAENITRLHIVRDGEERINITKDPEKEKFTWTMLAPYDSSMRMSDDNIRILTNKYVTYIFGENVDYDCTDFGKYGLDDPKTMIDIEYFTEDESGNKTVHTFTLYIGNLNDDGTMFYVKLNDSNSVYTISKVSIDSFTDVNATNFAEDYLFDTTVQELSKVVFQIKDKTYTLEAKDNAYTLNGASKNASDVGVFYTSINLLKNAQTATKDVSKTNPVCSISVTNKGNEELTYTFYEYDDNYYAIEHDGFVYFVIEKRRLDSAITAIEGL